MYATISIAGFMRTDKFISIDVSVIDCNGVGIGENTNTDFKIYPDPAKDKLQISFGNEKVNEIIIYSAAGNVIKQIIKKTCNSKVNIDLSNFAQGVYVVDVNFEDGREVRKKFVILK